MNSSSSLLWDLFLYFPDQIALVAAVIAVITTSITILVVGTVYKSTKHMSISIRELTTAVSDLRQAVNTIHVLITAQRSSIIREVPSFKNVYNEEDEDGAHISE